jgi:outer membrane protein OmpA-like peptidoglycan-associated protein
MILHSTLTKPPVKPAFERVFKCQVVFRFAVMVSIWLGGWSWLTPLSLSAQTQAPVDTAGATRADSAAASVLTSKYGIIRVHQPPAPAGVQAAVSLGRYIVNFGTREGVRPGGIFQVTEPDAILGLVRVEQVWRDSASVRLIRLDQKHKADDPMPLRRGQYLIPKYVLLETVLFDRGKPDLSPSMQERLRFAARFILSFPKFPVVIGGHTDNTGKETDNMKLSEARAAEIRTYLYEVQRIPQEQMHLKGYGETRAVASNDTDEGRHLNRRVEIVLVDRVP